MIKKRPGHLPEQFHIRPSSPIAINSFTHATAIGVPPRVPTHVIDGTPSSRINSFDLAAFTNPTGVPTISAGRTPYSTSLHIVSAADGAFPRHEIKCASKFQTLHHHRVWLDAVKRAVCSGVVYVMFPVYTLRASGMYVLIEMRRLRRVVNSVSKTTKQIRKKIISALTRSPCSIPIR